jgi:hypothetical protein
MQGIFLRIVAQSVTIVMQSVALVHEVPVQCMVAKEFFPMHMGQVVAVPAEAAVFNASAGGHMLQVNAQGVLV